MQEIPYGDVRNCPKKSVEGEPQVGRKWIQLHIPRPDSVKEAVWKIVCEMNQDDVSSVVRSETEILCIGESVLNSRKPYEKRNDYARQKMREMARLLITARAITPLKSTEDLVMPCNFPHVIQAVRSVAGYDVESNSYKIPSLALKLGHSLAKVAGIVQCNDGIALHNAMQCHHCKSPCCCRVCKAICHFTSEKVDRVHFSCRVGYTSTSQME